MKELKINERSVRRKNEHRLPTIFLNYNKVDDQSNNIAKETNIIILLNNISTTCNVS